MARTVGNEKKKAELSRSALQSVNTDGTRFVFVPKSHIWSSFSTFSNVIAVVG